MHLSVVGSGYVGTTTATCLAAVGHEVINVDIKPGVVDAINAGRPPVHEPGLGTLMTDAGDHLRATTSYDVLAEHEPEVVFLCLPTPQHTDGSLDLGAIRSATISLGLALAASETNPLIVLKSTVLPGTASGVVEPLLAATAGRDLEVAVNPEFLQMGTAVEDFQYPEKLVLGTASPDAADTLRRLYAPLLTESPDTVVLETGRREAELIKYANNAFLAAKVSLVNELTNIARAYGVDPSAVTGALAQDTRISPRFLRPGLGWGGSCFPKDVNALRAGARTQGYDPELLDAAVSVNDGQPERVVSALARYVALEGATVCLLGLAFKPHTDDVRGSRSLSIIDALLDRRASVIAYDPIIAESALPRRYADHPRVTLAPSSADALGGADGAILATAWPEFADLEPEFEAMAQRVLVNARALPVAADSLTVYDSLAGA